MRKQLFFATLLLTSACVVNTEPLPGPSGDAGPPGEAGPPGTFDTSTVQARIAGSCPTGQAIRAIDATGAVTCEPTASKDLIEAVTILQQKVADLEALDCPRLILPDGKVRAYKRNVAVSAWTECNFEIAPGYLDSMVRIGDFWTDQYEASISDSVQDCGGSFGDAPGQDTTAMPCSVKGQLPAATMSQLSAAASCANVGKHLCSNIEWQTTASGTADPDSWPDTDPSDDCAGVPSASSCTTCAATYGNTGQAGICVSRFGAYDMVGNVHEWVSDWLPVRGALAGVADQVGQWPATFGDDSTGQFASYACISTGCNEASKGMLGALFRGGGFRSSHGAGVFAVYSDRFPGFIASDVGFRCCAGSL